MGLLFTAMYRARALKPLLNFRGIKVPVTGNHVSRTVWKHVWKGGYERPELDALFALTRPTDRILELGTGMDIVSGVVAHANPQVQIEAYEANPELINAIRELHDINGIENVSVENAVLLPTKDETPIRFNLHANFTESSISDHVEARGAVNVPVRDFRKVLVEFAPDILVCDIEGAEEALFDGISLEGLRALIIEFHPALISRAATKRIYDTCAAAGLYPRIELSSQKVVAFERVDT